MNPVASLRPFALMSTLLLAVLLPPAAVAADLPGEVSINGVEFVLIPEGWFRYSVTTGLLSMQPAKAPLFRHFRVWLDSYYLAKYEARARDLVRFLNSGPEPAAMMDQQMRDSALSYAELEDQPDFACTVSKDASGVFSQVTEPEMPATNVSWIVANAFARWMGFRLPTEAEWEKAARGPDPQFRIWPWGDDYPDDTYAVFRLPTTCHPAPVTAYPKGRSYYGIYNMAGNVDEHVADWYNATFDRKLKDGVRNPVPALAGTPFPGEEPKKITKGGRWSGNPSDLVIGDRSFEQPNIGYLRMGVRFAVDAATVRRHLEQGTATDIKTK